VIDYSAIYRGLRREDYSGWMAMEFLPTGDVAAELGKAAAETVLPANRTFELSAPRHFTVSASCAFATWL
jgi:hypothetical protein